MEIKTDIQIAQENEMAHISQIAEKAGLAEEYVELYGNYKAKIDYRLLQNRKDRKDGKVILVTAISPTPAGEGKTTTTVGLADAMKRIDKDVIVALREPSLGPVFGIKGGAAGGGYAQVVPMEDINLHFTGDMHAIGAANNLLAAMLDNHIQQGNELGIDPRRITWKRCVDMNDRQLRFITDGLGGRINGTPREDGFDITVASEIMAILCLSRNIEDLKERVSRIVVGYAGKNTCADTRRPFREYRSWMQLGNGDTHGDENGGLRGDRSWIWRRSGSRKIPGYQMPHGGYQTVCSRCRCNGKSVETSRRRIQGGSGNRKPVSTGKRPA